MAGPSSAGAWCAVVGIPHFGVEAAAGFGVNLERLVLVPHPNEQWLGVTAALSDAVDLIVVKPGGRMNASNVSRLQARLRNKESALIVCDEQWPHSEATFSVTERNYRGLDDGYGYLTERHMDIAVTTRMSGIRQCRIMVPRSGSHFEPNFETTLQPVLPLPAMLADGEKSVSTPPSIPGTPMPLASEGAERDGR